jgi:hypothetical protein
VRTFPAGDAHPLIVDVQCGIALRLRLEPTATGQGATGGSLANP